MKMGVYLKYVHAEAQDHAQMQGNDKKEVDQFIGGIFPFIICLPREYREWLTHS